MRKELLVAAAATLSLALMQDAGSAKAQKAADIGKLLGRVVTKARNVDLSTAINLAGRQRMLIQKMSKEALFIALGIMPGNNRKRLENDVHTFETTLRGLHKGDARLHLSPTRDPAILKQLGIVESLWKDFRPLLLQIGEGGNQKKALQGIVKLNMPLLKAMNRAVQLYERRAPKGASGISRKVNLAGRQRMLTQKMTKEACLIASGIRPDAYRAELARTIATFDRTLKGLLDGDRELGLSETLEQAPRRQLQKVLAIWRDFRPLLNEPYTRKRLERLNRENLILLKAMDKAVRLLY